MAGQHPAVTAAPGSAGRVVARLPWMLTAAARGAGRARVSVAISTKQKPTVAKDSLAGPAP